MYCSHYRLQTFLGMVIDELKKPDLDPEKLQVLCIQFSLALSREAEEQREGATVRHEWRPSRR